MGLSHYPSAADGLLPFLIVNTLTTVEVLNKMVIWVLHMAGCRHEQSEEEQYPAAAQEESLCSSRRSISVTMFKSVDRSDDGCAKECCVCLHGFEGEEQVSELSCRHFFHEACLGKWLDEHSTCPLCRSTF